MFDKKILKMKMKLGMFSEKCRIFYDIVSYSAKQNDFPI